MNWKVRHEGSATAVEMPLEQLQEELLEGLWETTDEVQGPNDSDWQAIENHPVLADLAAEVELPPPRTYDDETRLDMNALIDVCLVLLVFFILTTTVAALQLRLDAPTADDAKARLPVYTKEQVKEQMISVRATLENGQPVIRVEDKIVRLEQLPAELRRFVRATNKTDLLLDHDDNVSHETVVQIIDAAKGVGMNRVRLRVP
jgi:biopolymer transport protein ExbD